MSFRKWLFMGMLLITVGRAAAQDSCPSVVQEALKSLDTNCELTERNQACYGNIALKATPQDNVSHFKFDTVGDIANLSDINTLDLEPMDEAAGKWGLVVMKVQADIPDTMPGQNITFVLFGDVTIQNLAKEGQKPMQAFYLTTGIGNSNCAEAPESGLMVQTPSGVKEVAFNVNGVDVEMGSTVIFQAEPGKQMRIKTIEGKARLTIHKKIFSVVQGSQFIAAVNAQNQVVDEGTLVPYEEQETQSLPVSTNTLDRQVVPAPPLTVNQIQEVQQRQQAGQLLCSDDAGSYLPPCTKPLVDANGDAVQHTDDGNVVLTAADGSPLFFDTDGNPITSMDDYYRFYSYWSDSSVITDDFGNTIEVTEDGTVSIQDAEGNVIVATPEGVYTYTGADGETHTFDDLGDTGGVQLDEEGHPIVENASGDLFAGDGTPIPDTTSDQNVEPTPDPNAGSTGDSQSNADSGSESTSEPGSDSGSGSVDQPPTSSGDQSGGGTVDQPPSDSGDQSGGGTVDQPPSAPAGDQGGGDQSGDTGGDDGSGG